MFILFRQKGTHILTLVLYLVYFSVGRFLCAINNNAKGLFYVLANDIFQLWKCEKLTADKRDGPQVLWNVIIWSKDLHAYLVSYGSLHVYLHSSTFVSGVNCGRFVMCGISITEGHLSITPPSIGRTRLCWLSRIVALRLLLPTVHPSRNVYVVPVSDQYRVLTTWYGYTAYLMPTSRAVLVCPPNRDHQVHEKRFGGNVEPHHTHLW